MATAVQAGQDDSARAHALLACIAARHGAIDTATQHVTATTSATRSPDHVQALCAKAEALIAHPEEDTWQ